MEALIVLFKISFKSELSRTESPAIVVPFGEATILIKSSAEIFFSGWF